MQKFESAQQKPVKSLPLTAQVDQMLSLGCRRDKHPPDGHQKPTISAKIHLKKYFFFIHYFLAGLTRRYKNLRIVLFIYDQYPKVYLGASCCLAQRNEE